MNDAVTVSLPRSLIEEALDLLGVLSEDLDAHIRQEYSGADHPAMERRMQRDLEVVNKAASLREEIAKSFSGASEFSIVTPAHMVRECCICGGKIGLGFMCGPCMAKRSRANVAYSMVVPPVPRPGFILGEL